ncbi:MAG: 4-hydroxythreonine-4-phosphate dehydrogenase PdxA [Spirochaetaceae bacterium]|nr:4-hydroxythreonine-4-phosphate dehydrogenase PdxA [Spirochaetaceae bacterium]MCF7939453.1 4-hydroxythreonine-4-phosphate dehydrogenase PdxA [Spirochaetales bacterium]
MINNTKPILGISVGDPAGIGPEITAKALNEQRVYDICRPLVVCDKRVMDEAVKFSGLNLKTRAVTNPAEGKYVHGTIDVLDMKNVDMDALEYKKVSAMCGRAAYEYIEKVINLALAKEIDATITGPINKEAINAAGIHEAGHTEIYAKLTNTKDYAMMLAEGDFRVVHVSTHVSLREAINRTKKERILKVINLADDALKKMDIAEPRIAVAGLNPHAGEGGMFGTEEIEEIIPAIEKARKAGKNVDGPIPPDTVFSKMKGGQYDIVVVMYHDQGHVPTKLAGFNYDRKTNTWLSMSGINITLGLPIIRSSVDHGTAFGKAGEGRANPESMLQAIEMGVRMV